MSNHLEISYISILRVFAVLAALVFLYFIRDIIALIFVSMFLAAAIMPWVNWFHKHSIPRSLAVVIIYLSAFTVVSLIVFLIIPPLVEQLSLLARSIPEFFQRFILNLDQLQQFKTEGNTAQTLQESLSSLQATLSAATQSIFSAVTSIFGGIVFFVAVLVLTLYMVMNEEIFLKFVHSLSPAQYKEYAVDFIKRAQVKLGQWLRGQLLLMFSIFFLTFIGLTIIGWMTGGIKFALVLALLAGLLELIPIAGPLISAIPAVILTLGNSPLQTILVVALYILVQQAENHLIVPKVMQKAVGLNPIITILAILVGAKIGGIMGAVLGVPVATVLNMLLVDWQSSRKSRMANGPEDTRQGATLPDSH